MNRLSKTIFAMSALAVTPCAFADKHPTSGVEVGKRVSAYRAVKTGGADDGVKVGQKLCYT